MKEQKRTGILRYILRSSIIACLVWAYFIPTKGYTQSDDVVVDKIIAKVDDYIILKSELERSYLEVLSRGELKGSRAKCQVLEGLVLNKLMAAKAELDSIVVPDEQVERDLDMRMNQILSQVGGDEEAIEKYYGKTIDEFKDELRDQVREQIQVEEMRRTITSDISITPADVQKFFNAIPKDSLPYFSSEVTVGQIVKKPGVNEETKNQAEQLLYDLKEQIQNGADFQELAREYSEGPSAQYGGNLGWVKRGQMVPEFEAVAMKLKPGELSEPVETQFGVHLIQSVDRRGNEYNARHILIQHKHKEVDFEMAAHFLDSIRTLIVNDTLTFAEAAKEHSDDKATSGNGGFFLSSTGSNKVPTSELDAGLFFTIDTMAVGNITKPIKFKMNDGKEAMRILYFKEKIKPHQATLEQDYQKIQLAAKNAKKNKIMNEWFKDAKDDVYIEVEDQYEYCKILQ